MDPIIELCYLLQHTAIMTLRQSEQVLQERLGLGVSQLRILMVLEHSPNIQQRKLADRLGQTEASISRQIKLLQEKGMLLVRTNPASRRERLVLPTPKGLKMTQAAFDTMSKHYAPMVEQLSGKQRERLSAMLQIFHNYICAPGQPFACDHPYEI